MWRSLLWLFFFVSHYFAEMEEWLRRQNVGESVQQQLLREGLKSVEMLSVLSAEDLVPCGREWQSSQ
jgi:hypothetical protein